MRFRTLPLVAVAALSLAEACSAKGSATPNKMAPASGRTLRILALNWIECSDWTSVKTVVTQSGGEWRGR